MKCIVCVDNNFGIGKDNKLLVTLKKDLNHFKKTTINNVVIMGSKTFESLPIKPLPNRLNIVISRNKKNVLLRDTLILSSIDEVFSFIKESKTSTDDIYIIGGESIYKLFLPFCDEVLLTKVNKTYDSDRFFPNIFNNKSWIKSYESNILIENGIEFKYINYKKIL